MKLNKPMAVGAALLMTSCFSLATSVTAFAEPVHFDGFGKGAVADWDFMSYSYLYNNQNNPEATFGFVSKNPEAINGYEKKVVADYLRDVRSLATLEASLKSMGISDAALKQARSRVLSRGDEVYAALSSTGAEDTQPANGKEAEVVAPQPATNGSSVYRLYNAALRVHLYTMDANEYSVLATRGWTQEGAAFQSATSGVPVYRLYNAALRVHLYTTNFNEYAVLATRGWTQEGVAFQSATSGKSVYRLYNEGLRVHLYTTDANEYSVLATRGWTQEGVAFLSAN